jgi:hypothetical protein
MSRGQDPQIYVELFFTLKAYQLTYANAIMHPLTWKYALLLQLTDATNIETDDESDFGNNAVLPSSTRRSTGRTAENDENTAPRLIIRCGLREGHTEKLFNSPLICIL